jgi:hypothetical protein
MTWPGLTQDVDRLCFTCQVCQMTKHELTCKKYGLLPPKIAESDPWIMDSNGLIFLFLYIPATNMDYTKTIFDNQATHLVMMMVNIDS